MLTTMTLIAGAALVFGFMLVFGLLALVFKIIGGLLHLVFSAVGFFFGAIGMVVGGLVSVGLGVAGAALVMLLFAPLLLPLLLIVGLVWAIRAASQPRVVQPPPITVVSR